VADFQNGLPVVQFDGSDDQLTRTALNFSGGFSIFLVVGAESYICGTFDGSSDNLIQRNADKLRIKADGTSNVFPGASWVDTSIYLVEFHSSGGGVGSDLEGVLNGSSHGVLGNGDEPWALGGFGGWDTGENYASDVGEFLFYSEQITGDGLTQVRTYLNDRWAVY
jgi:hypothetical protein